MLVRISKMCVKCTLRAIGFGFGVGFGHINQPEVRQQGTGTCTQFPKPETLCMRADIQT